MDIHKEYTKIIRRHVKSDRYGYNDNDVPKHANGKGCKGWYNRFSGTYQPFKLKGSDISTHLYGEAPFYIVNRPQSRTNLLCVDIDHNGADDALAVALRLNDDVFASGGFPEPSRHGKGAYLWVLLERDTSDDPDAANAILNGFSSYLRGSFNRPGSAKVDAIKATLFTPDSRGVLATAPCFFLHTDDHVASFIAWYQSCPTLPLSRLAETLSSLVPPASEQSSAKNSGGGSRGSSYMGGTSVFDSETEVGPIRRARLFRAMMIANPDTTEDEFVDRYQVLTPDNNRPDDVRDDFRKMKAKFEVHAPSFNPSPILPLCQTVPDGEFEWKRRERLDHERLADFVAVKLQDAFAQKENGYFAMASRDATLANFRVLKEKGLVDWICTQHQYTKLLDIACRHGLLHVYEPYRSPTRNSRGDKVFKGTARLIGPGEALPEQLKRFIRLFEQWKQSVRAAVA